MKLRSWLYEDGMGYLDEIPFKKYFWLKNIFLITYKNDSFPTRWDVFHSRDLTYRDEESRLSGMVFFHLLASSRQDGLKWMFRRISKALKQSSSHSKLK